MSVDYILFSAHTDYEQTSEFIRILKPSHVVLVHGEQNEMSRLKAALQRGKIVKVMGSFAMEKPKPTQIVSGVLVKRNFDYYSLAPSDLSKYTDMKTIEMGGDLTLKTRRSLIVAIPNVNKYRRIQS
ncbi:hypothetical protein PV326_012388 [Microctonus aethiopoides]|nr:hypothetical protein PV326_012388 [Microctonus aethiopoides]